MQESFPHKRGVTKSEIAELNRISDSTTKHAEYAKGEVTKVGLLVVIARCPGRSAWPISLMPFRAAVGVVLGFDGGFEVHIVDVGQGAEPGEDIGEFAGQVLAAGGVHPLPGFLLQRCGQLADLLDQPHEGARRAACLVGGVVAIADHGLKPAKRQAIDRFGCRAGFLA